MKIIRSTVLISIFVFIMSGLVQASSFYLHDHANYWWYIQQAPGFSIVVPNTAERYVQKQYFGRSVLEMTWNDGAVIMEIGSIQGHEVSEVQQFVAGRFTPFVGNINVLSNRQITTSNDLFAHFYAFDGIGSDGKRSMLRSVYFNREDVVVYLALYLPSASYRGDLQSHWLRAVNEFEW